MTNENTGILRSIGVLIIFVLIVSIFIYTFSGFIAPDNSENSNSPSPDAESNESRDAINQNNENNNKDDNVSDQNNDGNGTNRGEHTSTPARVSLTVTAETINNNTVSRGQYSLYAAPLLSSNKEITTHNISEEGSSHTFNNLTDGDRYILEVDPVAFPAENFTIEAGQSDKFTPRIGYKLPGAETYIREYNVSELTLSGDTVVGSQDLIGEAQVDSEGNFYTTFQLKRFLGDPSEGVYEGLYIAEENAGYKNSLSLRDGWKRIGNASGAGTLADELVQNGLAAYNRTFIDEVQRDTELFHRYQTEVGIVDVDPQTGYIMYADLDVSDVDDIARAQNWYSNHNETDFSAIPDDFERPDSE